MSTHPFDALVNRVLMPVDLATAPGVSSVADFDAAMRGYAAEMLRRQAERFGESATIGHAVTVLFDEVYDAMIISPVMIGPHEADYLYDQGDPDHLSSPSDLCFTCSDFEAGRYVPIGFCHMINVDTYDPINRPLSYLPRMARDRRAAS